MKKLFIAAFLLIAFLPLSAQHFHWDVEAGMNLTHFRYSGNYNAEKIGGMKPGFRIGVNAGYEFRRHWMLTAGLSYMNTYSEMKLRSAATFDAEIRQNHLMVPVRLGYNIRIGRRLSLVPSVGLYGMLNFGGSNSSLSYLSGTSPVTADWNPMDGFSTTVPMQNPEGTPSGKDWPASVDAFRRWTFGAVGELKAVVDGHYTVGVSYFEDIQKVQKQHGLRCYGLMMSVGYCF